MKDGKFALLSAMKFFGAIVVYLLFALLIGWGILSTVHGNVWILLGALLLYGTMLVKIGCLPKKTH